MKKIAVIATEQDFRGWISCAPRLDREVFMRISRLDQIRGNRFLCVLRVGGYHYLPDHDELYTAALQRVVD